jgi:uncharacterized protein YjcR
MKEEARYQARRMFLDAGGDISNVDIAKAVKVNPLTVGRWRKKEKWDEQILSGSGVADMSATAIRKKAEKDKALGLYLEAGGNITNKELSEKVGVSPATVSKWKEQDNWISKILEDVDYNDADADAEDDEIPVRVKEVVRVGAPKKDDDVAVGDAAKDWDFNVGELLAPEQILLLNKRIGELLKREYMSADEIAALAEAKSDLLDAVATFLGIAGDYGEIHNE